MPTHLPHPHGGTLINLLAPPTKATELRELAGRCPSWDLTDRQLCDLELLINGGFSPLTGFLNRADYESVRDNMRLAGGLLWPIPVVLRVTAKAARDFERAGRVALRDAEGVPLAILDVQDTWDPDLRLEAERVFGTTSRQHPGVAWLMDRAHSVCVGGTVESIELPRHYDFRELRASPAELRERFAADGWRKVVAFQTRNPMHRAHHELTLQATDRLGAKLLIHPAVGMTKPGDVDHYTRVRCYQAVAERYPQGSALLSLLPLAMRMAGPREAVWHGIIRKNYGCTHFVVGRDHAGPGTGSDGEIFYDPYEAQELFARHQDQLGIEMAAFPTMVYLPQQDRYVSEDDVPAGASVLALSGGELRKRLAEGRRIPAWFSFPEVIRELRRTYPPRSEQGFTVFFTGLPSSGKSTLANVLMVKLLEIGGRPVTLLDGDLVRKHLSSELGFSKEHRDINIRRIGWVASENTKNGGITLCAPIAPYDATRKDVRAMIEPKGGFVLVHVATPLTVCERRDRKGLYAKARAGAIKQFTGISDPYEQPEEAEVVIDTSDRPPEACVQQILEYLAEMGYIATTA